jgi:DNA-binding NarL/FixJ family response regulator
VHPCECHPPEGAIHAAIEYSANKGFPPKPNDGEPKDNKCTDCSLLREKDEIIRKLSVWREGTASDLRRLTARQRQIMNLVVAGHPSKNIAADLNISQRTVENHRASIMKRTGSKSLPALTRFALAASWSHPEETADAVQGTGLPYT